MKKLVFIFMLLLVPTLNAYSATFSAGTVLTIIFSDLEYLGESDSIDTVDTSSVSFPNLIGIEDGEIQGVPALDEGGQFVLSFYENINDTTPYTSNTVDGPYYGGGFGWGREQFLTLSGIIDGDLLWEDFDGKITISIIEGTLKLNSLDIQVEIDGNLWGDTFFDDTFQVSSMPVPSAAMLLVTGLLGLVGLIRR